MPRSIPSTRNAHAPPPSLLQSSPRSVVYVSYARGANFLSWVDSAPGRTSKQLGTHQPDTSSDAQACSHKPTLLAEAALLHTDVEGGAASRDGGGCAGSGERGAAAADLYGPGNRYRLSVREPARMTAELRAREREQEERVSD